MHFALMELITLDSLLEKTCLLGGCRAVVWQNGTTTAQVLNPAGCVYARALGINDLGQIVGEACDQNGKYCAVMWQPVPEPGAIVVLVYGIVGLGWKCRKTQSLRPSSPNPKMILQ